MRYVIAAILSYTLAVPMAQALPVARPHSASVSQQSPILRVASHKKAPARSSARRSRNTGGIHPLVGSGDY